MTDETDGIPPAANLKDLAVQITRLSSEDQRAIADAVLNPPPPSPALLRAAKAARKNLQARAAARDELARLGQEMGIGYED